MTFAEKKIQLISKIFAFQSTYHKMKQLSSITGLTKMLLPPRKGSLNIA
jgi:hypothetical protein